MRRIFLNEEYFYTKLEDVISEHKCLRLKLDGNKYEITIIQKLGCWRNRLLHPILSHADSCKLKTEKTSLLSVLI